MRFAHVVTGATRRLVRRLPHGWLPAALAALTLGTLIWFLCTADNTRRLHDAGGGADEPRTFPFFSVGRQLSYWLSFWVREPEELGELASWSLWIQPEDQGAVVVQIALTALLCAAFTVRVLRSLPPTVRRWPLTLLGCWGAAALAGLVAAGLAALVRDTEDHQDRGEMLGLFTSAALPVPVAFGLLAAVVGTCSAALDRRSRRTERTGDGTVPAHAPTHVPANEVGTPPVGTPPEDRPPYGARGDGGAGTPGPRREPFWTGLVVGGVFAVVALGLGHLAVIQWLLDEGPAADHVPFWLVDVAMPGFWHWGDPVESGVTGLASLLTLVAQAVLAGGLFWLVARQLVGPTAADFPMVGAWTGLLAGLLARPVGEQLGSVDDRPLMMSVQGGFQFAPGACVVGALGGVAVWLIHRLLERWTAHGAGMAGDGARTPPAGGPDEGPEDELVIRLTR